MLQTGLNGGGGGLFHFLHVLPIPRELILYLDNTYLENVVMLLLF